MGREPGLLCIYGRKMYGKKSVQSKKEMSKKLQRKTWSVRVLDEPCQAVYITINKTLFCLKGERE